MRANPALVQPAASHCLPFHAFAHFRRITKLKLVQIQVFSAVSTTDMADFWLETRWARLL